MIGRRPRWWVVVLGIVACAGAAEAQQRGRAKGGAARGGARDEAGGPAGRWVGQDGQDLVGPQTAVAASDVQDIHIALGGLPDKPIAFAKVSALGGGEWLYKGAFGPWGAEIRRDPGSSRADLFIEPSQVEAGRPFQIHLRFDDGQVAEFEVAGGRADPNLRVAGAAMAAEWGGQVREDRVGGGPAVGPDGIQDAKIALRKLSKSVEIAGIAVAGPGGQRWQSGVNPKGFASAELIRDGKDPSRADLFLSFARDPKGQALTLEVTYGNGKVDGARVVAGTFDPKKKAPRAEAPESDRLAVSAEWVGQDGTNRVGPGDVHVRLSGLPARPVAAAALSDGARGLWAARIREDVPFDAGEGAIPLSFLPDDDPSRADLRFPPFRDETGRTMTLRLRFVSGRDAVFSFPGGAADPGLRASYSPAPTTATAHPGDDLNDLAARFGTIRLAPGRYPMARPLILERPVVVAGEPGASLVFSQPEGAAPWSAAIKIHSGHTTLEGFSVRFAGPIRWVPGLADGPAVIGTTDRSDPGPGDLKADIRVRSLDLEGPPPSGPWEEAPRLIRMGDAVCGAIEKNTLRGGTIDVNGGPWRVEGNRYVGTQPGTYAYSVISAHRTHDLVVRGNVARPSGPSGKTWRFLVMTGSGDSDVIAGNEVSGIGPRDDDGVAPQNAPEIILTEAYHLHFEGRPSSVSADGLSLAIPYLHGGRAGAGDVVSILSGPAAGQYRRIAQATGPTTFLMADALPRGDYAISISTGFVGTTFRGNTIDARGSSAAAGMVLVGNLFGLRVLDNHFLGAGEAFRITAAPSETPVHWGWSHAPLLGATIEGNTVEDSLRGGTVCVEHSPAIKTSRGRVYASAAIRGNTFSWTDAFAESLATRGLARPPALTIGDPGSLDPSEMVASLAQNRASGRHPIAIAVPAAVVDGSPTRDRHLPLPAAPRR